MNKVLAICTMVISSVTWAESSDSIATAELNYRNCVVAELSTLDTASVKQTNIDVNCDALKQAFIASYPADVQDWVQANIEARLVNILDSLTSFEGVFDEIEQDSQTLENGLSEIN